MDYVDNPKFNHYVRRLGQWHISEVGSKGYTLCGVPMLSNNYQADFMRSEVGRSRLQPCEECHGKAIKIHKESNVK